MANEIIRPSELPLRSAPVASELTVSDNGSTVAGVTWEDGVNAAVPPASQSESEAGVINSKRMTPLTTKQAIDAQVGPIISAAIGDLNLGSASQSNVEDFATSAQGALADSAVQPSDPALVPPGGSTSQVLIKSSNTDYDTEWTTSAAATAVSYAPQELTSEQRLQAQSNLSLVNFKTVPLLLADQLMSYATDPGKIHVGPGDVIEAQGFRYEVAASDATDAPEIIETSGAVKAEAINPILMPQALGVVADGSTDDHIPLQNAMYAAWEKGYVLHLPPGRYLTSKPLLLPCGASGDLRGVQMRGSAPGQTVLLKTSDEVLSGVHSTVNNLNAVLIPTMRDFGIPAPRYSHIEGFSILHEGVSEGFPPRGISIDRMSNSIIEDMDIKTNHEIIDSYGFYAREIWECHISRIRSQSDRPFRLNSGTTISGGSLWAVGGSVGYQLGISSSDLSGIAVEFAKDGAVLFSLTFFSASRLSGVNIESCKNASRAFHIANSRGVTIDGIIAGLDAEDGSGLFNAGLEESCYFFVNNSQVDVRGLRFPKINPVSGTQNGQLANLRADAALKIANLTKLPEFETANFFLTSTSRLMSSMPYQAPTASGATLDDLRGDFNQLLLKLRGAGLMDLS